MTKIPTRRAYLCSMSDGSIGVGVYLQDSHLKIYVVTYLPFYGIGEQVIDIFDKYEIEHLVVSYPGSERACHYGADRAVFSIAYLNRIPTIVLFAREVADVEHILRSNAKFKRSDDYTADTVERLFLAHQAAMHVDVAFGGWMRFDDDMRFRQAGEKIINLEADLDMHRLALAECEAEGATVQ